MSKQGIDTMSILSRMGIKEYQARVAYNSYALMHNDVSVQHITGRLGHHLGKAIADNPFHIMNMTTKIEQHQFGFTGDSVYEMSAFVFSKDQLKEFAQKLLNAYGDGFATARMETLQKKLKSDLKSELSAAVSDAVDDVVDDL